MNSCTGVEGAIQKSETESLAGNTPVVTANAVAETRIGAGFAELASQYEPETILLVEDEAFVRKVTTEVLESAGYRLMIAGSGAEALEAYRRCCRPVDLLLADVVMPGMSGRDLALEFENLCPRGRVLLMSGHAEKLDQSEPSHHGRVYLAKPFSSRVLLRKVREVLETNPFEAGAQA